VAKEVTAKIKLQAPGGQATPAPPIGPALGPHGVNPGPFIQQFNERTRPLNGKIVTVLITVYADRTFEFEVKSPPAAEMIKDAAGIAKGSGVPHTEKVGKLTRAQVEAIAEEKMEDLTAHSLDAACRIIEGTARAAGITVLEESKG
jgi:large subunit ribosomal protein L11